MFQYDSAAAGVCLRVVDHVIELLGAVTRVFPASRRGLLDGGGIPFAFSERHPHVIVAEVFERAREIAAGRVSRVVVDDNNLEVIFRDGTSAFSRKEPTKTTIEQLISVADAGKIMPPKSTWFEPKLRDGLLVHKI